MAGVIVQWNSVTTLVGLCTFLVHTRLLGRTLTASQGFTSLSLFGILRFPLLVLPDVVNFYLQVRRHCTSFSHERIVYLHLKYLNFTTVFTFRKTQN